MGNRYRWFTWSLFFCLILCLTACGAEEKAVPEVKKETSRAGETESTAKEKVLRIGVSIYRYDDDFMKLYRQELKQYLEETYHAEVVMRNARGDQKEQADQIEDFIESGCDGIIVNLVSVDRAGEAADACVKAGIPLVFINREPSKEEQQRWETEKMDVSCVSTDSKQAGTYQGELILETPDRGDMNGDGKVSYVMIMGEQGNEDSIYRTEYSIKALEDSGMPTEELFLGHGDWIEEEGQRLAEEALELYGNRIEVIFCNNDAMANGALKAVLASGRRVGRELYLVGVDALEETVGYIKEGDITGTVLNDHTGQSHMAADVLMKKIAGEKTDKRYLVDYVKITGISSLR